MKKTNIFKLIVVAAVACVTVVACIAFAGCGKKVELVDTYKEYVATNHSTPNIAVEAPKGYQHEYTLKVYSDNTYEMQYEAFYAITQWTGAPSRTVIQYGTYEKANGTEEGTVVYTLSKPTRVVFFAKMAGQTADHGVIAYADSATWDTIYPKTDDNTLLYALHSRSESEEYKSGEQLLNTLGRSYTVTCTTETHRMEVKVTSHKGDQINGYDNIYPVDAWVD